jgi:hypothetical protein
MKNFFFIISLVFFTSCTKKHTYICTEIYNDGYSTPTITETTHTGWTSDDATKYETRSYMVFNNGKGLRRVICSIKN